MAAEMMFNLGRGVSQSGRRLEVTKSIQSEGGGEVMRGTRSGVGEGLRWVRRRRRSMVRVRLSTV